MSDLRGMTFAVSYSSTLVTETCYSCGVLFAMPTDFYRNRQADKKNFYCPNGHSQHYVGKTPEQKLREAEAQLTHLKDQQAAERRRARENREALERSNAALKGVITKTKKRVSNGVCPCCQRTFQDLARHMGNKHPNYKA